MTINSQKYSVTDAEGSTHTLIYWILSSDSNLLYTFNFYQTSSNIVVNGNHARDFISLLRSNLIKIDRRLTEYVNNLVVEAPLPEQSESLKTQEIKHL